MAKRRTKDDIIKQLENLVANPDFLVSFCFMIVNDFYYNPDKVLDINWRARLSFQEANYLLGLLLKQKQVVVNYPEIAQIKKLANKIKKLLQDLHNSYSDTFIDSFVEQIKEQETQKGTNASIDKMNSIFSQGDLAIENMFYGDSGGYDFQFWELSVPKYKKDSDWIRNNLGLSMEDLVDISKKLKELPSKKLQSDIRDPVHVLSFSTKELEDICGKDKAAAFIKCFVATSNDVNKSYKLPEEYNPISNKPIIPLNHDNYLLPIHFDLCESVFTSPFYWMIRDEKYKDTALKHRGETTQEIAVEMLKRIFKPEEIYQNVTIERKKGERLTDIDILCLLGNKALVFQCKSKKLSLASRLGDEYNLSTDFTKAVQEPYEQGKLARAAVLKRDCKFIDEKGNEIKLSESIEDAFLVCLLAEHYPGLHNQINCRLQKQDEDPFPVVWSLVDLDIISFYLTNPFRFAYYIRQRSLLFDYFWADSEISFLSYHLKQKLFKISGKDKVALDESFAQYIDGSFPALKGYQPKTKAVDKLQTKWKNENFNKLVSQVIATRNPGFTDAVFFLYDMEGKGADETIKFIEEAKKRCTASGKPASATMINKEERFGTSYLVEQGFSPNLMQKVLAYGQLAKYKHKADIWLSLGSFLNSGNYIDAVAFSNQPWVKNTQMEYLVNQQLRAGTFINIDKKVGRNDKCPCGSGMKYKKCCGKS